MAVGGTGYGGRVRNPEVAVVGAGIVGLCTAYALVERGIAVRVYEQSVPGNGQSGGVSRIFRHAHDDPRLIAYAVESRAVYEEWIVVDGRRWRRTDPAIPADALDDFGPRDREW